MAQGFHEVRFPTGISRGATGGPERRTEIVVLGSGHEERNSRWADSRRKYNAGYGIRTLDEIHSVVHFFENRRGRLHGFRWKDHADFKSCDPTRQIAGSDQVLGLGDGVSSQFQLVKSYGQGEGAWLREIGKPVGGTVKVKADGVPQIEGADYSVDQTTGIITFFAGSIPGSGLEVTAGYEFDVPVRFDTDVLEISLTGFEAGQIPDIPLVEIRL